jgi:leader peptidase (prepilin peptidase)/N-methyltransferase
MPPQGAGVVGVNDGASNSPRRPSVTARVWAGVLALAVGLTSFLSYGTGTGAVLAAFVALVLVVLAVIDIERRIIPNWIVLPAAAVALAGRIAEFPHRGLEFALAAMGIALVLLLPSLVSRSAMGMGDVKLGLLLGAALGWAAIDALLVAFLCAVPVSAAILLRGGRSARKDHDPARPVLRCRRRRGLDRPSSLTPERRRTSIENHGSVLGVL